MKEMYTSQSTITTYEANTYLGVEVNPSREYWDNTGYQPYEPVQGYTLLSAGQKLLKPENRLNI